MFAIVKELTIAAPPQKVFNALTQQDEIVRWWAEKAHVKPEVGALGEFRFRPPAGTLKVEVTELEPNEKVAWASRQVPPQWAGTSVSWRLLPVEGNTHVTFTHDGFAQQDAVNTAIAENWEQFLASLKAYLETGQGTPGQPRHINRS